LFQANYYYMLLRPKGNVLKCLEKDYGVRYPIGIKEVDKGKIP